MSSLRDLRARRARLMADLEARGGRGVDLAEEIDEIDAEIELRENPISSKEARRIVFMLAQRYLDECGIPEDDSIADTERLRTAIIETAMKKVGDSLKEAT